MQLCSVTCAPLFNQYLPNTSGHHAILPRRVHDEERLAAGSWQLATGNWQAGRHRRDNVSMVNKGLVRPASLPGPDKVMSITLLHTCPNLPNLPHSTRPWLVLQLVTHPRRLVAVPDGSGVPLAKGMREGCCNQSYGVHDMYISRGGRSFPRSLATTSPSSPSSWQAVEILIASPMTLEGHTNVNGHLAS